MANIECSFCGTSAPHEEAKSRFIAGPQVFVCRDCVEMMIEIFSEKDPQWGKRTIKTLKAMCTGMNFFALSLGRLRSLRVPWGTTR